MDISGTARPAGRSSGRLATNWAGNVAYRAARVHRPGSVGQLQRIVAAARQLRAVGTGHSFNRIADTAGEQVSVSSLPRILDVDTARRRVRVSAGLRYGELVGHVHRAGLALRNLGSLPHISVAGACATGTHGSGVGNGTLASAVAALEMVTPDGSLVLLSRAEDTDRFDGCVVALGALGVVTALELELEPAYWLAQSVYEGLPRSALREHFDEIMAAGYSVSLFSDWRHGDVDQVWRKVRVDEPGAAADRQQPPMPERWFGARLADGPRHPIPGLAGDTCTDQLGVPGPWYARLPHFRMEFTPSSGQELQSEWFVHRRDAVAALDALAELRASVVPVLQVAEVRTIAADPLWLSPSAGRDTVALHFTWVADERAVTPVAVAIDRRLVAFEARPHWGKLLVTPPAVVRQRYARYDDFEALLREYDPAGKLRNEVIEAYFPGAA